ncbi:FAD linked oxidase domain protein [Gloeothece citriformis PCC 7424]|uniref:FAD linked oxidase domain protein n=1 Tax=Gloeothece citriformis (strain PCC 7424) TaxID=65393 RepID=B7KJG6_GLOC7|nr:FAD-binding oxidoreductase [Gloeothece citriformis]ACK73643.1 FAD linked oxidase domain protein [Gloeothece citriformis PCC 7424]
MTLTDWPTITDELAHLDLITDPTGVAKLSLDYYHFSPILEKKLQDKRGNLVIRPVNESEVLQIAKTCVKHKVPLTVRGAGTGNYGQCIPLEGGIILDTTKMNQIRWIKPGLACVEPGVKMAAFDKKAREIGWELRMAPSTYRTATIGGFIGGGSVGMGSITYGQLRDRGSLRAVRVVTLEDEPRILELRGDEVQKVNHAYGTNGIITELEIPLAPAHPWVELIVVFDEFMTAARFGQALGDSDGIVKKLVSIHAWPIPSYFTALESYLPKGKHCAFVMIADYDLEPFQDLVKEYNGQVTYQKTPQEASKGTSLLEFTWNHTTLLARSIDPNLTYLQTFYFTLERVEQMYHHFGDEAMIHLEFLRFHGKAIPAGLQLIRFTTEERLNEIIRYHEEQGAGIANPHTYILEDGGRKVIDLDQVCFKEKVDPYGLMNPGKMRGWLEREKA